MIILRSNSFLGIWVGMELNILRFIPILRYFETQYLMERGVKYFLVQGLASILFIFTSARFLVARCNLFRLAFFRLIVKLGAAPFHGWFLNLINTTSLRTLFFLSTIQKIGPLIITARIARKPFFYEILVFTIFIGAVVGMVGARIGKILAASRLVNLSWIMIGVLEGVGLFFRFFLIYSVVLRTVILIYTHCSFRDRACIRGARFWVRASFIISLISLGRMPPLLGFMGKILLIKRCVGHLSFFIVLYLVLRSAIILSLYIRFIYRRVSAPTGLLTEQSPPSLIASLTIRTIFLFPVRAFSLV